MTKGFVRICAILDASNAMCARADWTTDAIRQLIESLKRDELQITLDVYLVTGVARRIVHGIRADIFDFSWLRAALQFGGADPDAESLNDAIDACRLDLADQTRSEDALIAFVLRDESLLSNVKFDAAIDDAKLLLFADEAWRPVAPPSGEAQQYAASTAEAEAGEAEAGEAEAGEEEHAPAEPEPVPLPEEPEAPEAGETEAGKEEYAPAEPEPVPLPEEPEAPEAEAGEEEYEYVEAELADDENDLPEDDEEIEDEEALEEEYEETLNVEAEPVEEVVDNLEESAIPEAAEEEASEEEYAPVEPGLVDVPEAEEDEAVEEEYDEAEPGDEAEELPKELEETEYEEAPEEEFVETLDDETEPVDEPEDLPEEVEEIEDEEASEEENVATLDDEAEPVDEADELPEEVEEIEEEETPEEEIAETLDVEADPVEEAEELPEEVEKIEDEDATEEEIDETLDDEVAPVDDAEGEDAAVETTEENVADEGEAPREPEPRVTYGFVGNAPFFPGNAVTPAEASLPASSPETIERENSIEEGSNDDGADENPIEVVPETDVATAQVEFEDANDETDVDTSNDISNEQTEPEVEPPTSVETTPNAEEKQTPSNANEAADAKEPEPAAQRDAFAFSSAYQKELFGFPIPTATENQTEIQEDQRAETNADEVEKIDPENARESTSSDDSVTPTESSTPTPADATTPPDETIASVENAPDTEEEPVVILPSANVFTINSRPLVAPNTDASPLRDKNVKAKDDKREEAPAPLATPQYAFVPTVLASPVETAPRERRQTTTKPVETPVKANVDAANTQEDARASEPAVPEQDLRKTTDAQGDDDVSEPTNASSRETERELNARTTNDDASPDLANVQQNDGQQNDGQRNGDVDSDDDDSDADDSDDDENPYGEQYQYRKPNFVDKIKRLFGKLFD